MEVDIEGGYPVEREQEKKREERERREVSYAGITSSREGKKVIELIEGFLYQEVERLLREDPKCQAYLGILMAISSHENQAKKITEAVMKRRTAKL